MASSGRPESPARPPHRGGAEEHHLLEATHALWEAVEHALSFPENVRPRGLGRRATRALHAGSVLLLLLFAVGWTWAIVEEVESPADAPRDTAALSAATLVADAVRGDGRPPAAYLLDVATAAFAPPRGESGHLSALIAEPGDSLPPAALPHGAQLRLARDGGDTIATAGKRVPPGIWQLAVALGELVRPLRDFSVISTRPLSERRNGRLGDYVVGVWPSEHEAREGYRTPRGLIEVTPENRDTPLSRHFTLRDFLTKGQTDVWPKYLLVDTRLVDKLELVLDELRAEGFATEGVTVMSGFRTPSYNASGGDTRGRATFSRHVYGDAADVFIDNDGDGRMDDLNGDGRETIADARVLLELVERVEARHPSLVGGAGVYPSGAAHGPFIHIDTRGYAARWTGEAQ